MSNNNTNCDNIEDCSSYYYCSSYCYSCYSCYSCSYCSYCSSCYSCYSCYSCSYCSYCYYSKNLKMSGKMIFCLGEGDYKNSGIGYQQNLRIFNQKVTEEEYNETKKALDAKDFKLPITKWINGSLETLNYEDAWKEMWSEMKQEDKDFITSIKNFNAEIFEGITGIKIEEETSAEQEAIALLKKKGYKIVKE